MHVSVIICTWNRAESLRRTLESLCALESGGEQVWELIVVNNNSSDATDDVIAAFEGRLPIRGVLEREVGLSRARNTGARAATGELVLFTDDDVEVDPRWLAAYVAAARLWPDAGYFGGEIHALLAADVPAWVRRHKAELSGMLCTRDLGSEARVLPEREFPYGPNMAIRREAFSRGLFDEDVGRKGRGQMRGSEDSLFRALERQGICGVWVPDARVGHHIPRSRATLRYLWQYYHGSGRGGARLDSAASVYRRDQLARTRRAAGRLARDRSRWPGHLASLAKETGRLRESLRAALSPNVADGRSASRQGKAGDIDMTET